MKKKEQRWDNTPCMWYLYLSQTGRECLRNRVSVPWKSVSDVTHCEQCKRFHEFIAYIKGFTFEIMYSRCYLLLPAPRSVKCLRMVLGRIKGDLLLPGSENMQLGTWNELIVSCEMRSCHFTFWSILSNQKVKTLSVTDFGKCLPII